MTFDLFNAALGNNGFMADDKQRFYEVQLQLVDDLHN